MTDETEDPDFTEATPHLPENVVSLQECVFCGSRDVVCHMGPHLVDFWFQGQIVETDEIEFPAFECTMCNEGWTDWRAEEIRDAWQLERVAKYYGT